MTYTRPFVTPGFTAYAGDSQAKALSLAVDVVDTFTGQPANVNLRVLLKERKQARAILNLSGYYCFEEVPNDNYTLVTEPDRATADWFFLQPVGGNPWPANFETAVSLPACDDLTHVELNIGTGVMFASASVEERGIVQRKHRLAPRSPSKR